MVKKVEMLLNDQNPHLASIPIHERCEKELISEKQILNAITQVIYRQRHMAVTAAANLETLNINKVSTTWAFFSEYKTKIINTIQNKYNSKTFELRIFTLLLDKSW